MDPSQATEFASPRYFDKLRPRDQPQAASAQDAATHSLPWIPPVQEQVLQHTGDLLKAAEKRRFGAFRSILPLRTANEHEQRRGPAESSKKQSTPRDQLFEKLPTELKIQIIAPLPLSDVLNMRLASRSWHAMVSSNEKPIARYHLRHHIPAYAKRLYPIPPMSEINLHYLCGLWHRLHVAAKMAYLICEWTTEEIFLRDTPAKRKEFAPQWERMRRRLIPLLFTVFHFFETYRILHVRFVEEHGHGLLREPYTINPIEAEIMNSYNDRTLLQVHQVFPLVVSSFCRQLRPPSYVGRVERSLRGYFKDKPADEVYATALCVGGLGQIERFWQIKPYNTRRSVVDTWYNGIIREPAEAVAKSRRAFGLSRRKSTYSIKDSTTDGHPSHSPHKRGRSGSDGGQRNGDLCMTATTPQSGVFSTSLSAGRPMSPLSREQLRLIVSDMPALQQIWLPTAEALILDRKIVERPQDIKRNQQILLDLVRDDGSDYEDEWCYGSAAPESVRPPTEAIGDHPTA